MGYVFGKAFWWILAALLVGGVIGWFWNGWRKSRWVDTTSSTTKLSASELSEQERLRHRVANLESVVPERDRLSARVSELEAELKAGKPAPAFAGIPEADHQTVLNERDTLGTRVADLEAQLADAEARAADARSSMNALAGERDGLQGQVADLESRLADCEQARTAAPATIAGFAGVAGVVADVDTAPAEPVSRFAGIEHDWDQAAAVLGKRIKLDDLKVVEGIGPKIEELIHGGGVTTWAGLADTPVERLQEILDAAGDRYRVHNPGTWPRQAELLALGRWDEFKQLTDQLDAGRD